MTDFLSQPPPKEKPKKSDDLGNERKNPLLSVHKLPGKFDGKEVRFIFARGGFPWFFVRDVCKALHWSNPVIAINKLGDQKERVTRSTEGLLIEKENRSWARSPILINIEGIYLFSEISGKKRGGSVFPVYVGQNLWEFLLESVRVAVYLEGSLGTTINLLTRRKPYPGATKQEIESIISVLEKQNTIKRIGTLFYDGPYQL